MIPVINPHRCGRQPSFVKDYPQENLANFFIICEHCTVKVQATDKAHVIDKWNALFPREGDAK